MKKYIYSFLLFMVLTLVSLTSCKSDGYELYNSPARIQWQDTITVQQTFVDKAESVMRDTIWLKAKVMGGPSDVARRLNIRQVKGYTYTVNYDNSGNIVDTTKVEVPNQATPGTHYVAFDSQEMQALLLQKTKNNSQNTDVEMDIPIIILKDASLDKQNYSLYIEIIQSDDFLPGEKNNIQKRITISNQLVKPSGWDLWQTFYLGDYSIVKHKFMNETLHTTIDNTWLNQPRGIITYYREKCRRALDAFNSNADNISKGIAPLREDPNNPNSKPITFPTQL